MKRKVYSEKKPSILLGFFFIIIITVSMLMHTHVSAAERTYKDLWDAEKNAYIIQSSDDFILFRSAMDTDTFEKKVILLEKDITVDKELPVINTTSLFRGYFNGQGHTIDGIVANNVRVFPKIMGVLTNTKFTNMQINGKGSFMTGVGELYEPVGELSYCTIQGEYSAPYTTIYTIGSNYGSINNCIIDMNLSSTLEKPVTFYGVAKNGGLIENCAFIGNIDVTEAQKGKSICAIANKEEVVNCYYAEKDYYTEDGLGRPCTEENLKDKTTYEGFDFENIWNIDEEINNGYPFLRSDIQDDLLPTLPDVVELPLTYKLSLGDVTYNEEEKSFDRYFPVTMTGPEYTGSDDAIKEKLSDILTQCDVKAEVRAQKEMDPSNLKLLEVIPRDGYSIDMKGRPGEGYVKYSSKPYKDTGYKVIVSFEWENAQAKFTANVIPTELTGEAKDEYIAKTHETMKAIIDMYVTQYQDEWKGDPWFAFTCGRCEYYPEGITEDMIYDNIVDARWKQYEGTKQEDLPTDFDMNAISKDILAVTAIGYDATNVCGIDLVEILNNRSMDNGNYFAFQYKAYALYSGGYGGDYAQMGKDLTQSFINDNFESLKDSYDTDDMKTMQMQPIFLYKNEEGMADNIQKVVQWLSQSQTVIGSFPGYNGFGNPWTNAQVHILMGLCDIDFLSPEFVKNGTTILDSIIARPASSLGYAAERTQCAKGLAALTRSYEGKTDLFDCSDVKGALYVNRLIQNLPDVITLEDKQTVADIRAAYDALSEGKQAAVRGYQKLENAEAVISEAEKLQEKAKAFCDKIDTQLPAAKDELTLENKETVNKLSEELQNMDEDVKQYVSEAYRNKLAEYAERIADLEEAQKVIDKINAVGEVTLSSETAIRESRSAYEALANDTQKQIVKDRGALKVLEDAEAALKEQQNVTVENVIKNIEQFRNTEEIVLEDEEVLINIRNMFDALPESLKSQVTNMDVLETAEAVMKGLKTDHVLALIRSLKGKEELQTVKEDGTVVDNITVEDIASIAAAQAAMDDLKDKYADIESDIKTMDGGEALLAKLAEVNTIASEYEGYVQAYLQKLIDDIMAISEVDNTNIGTVEAYLAKYEEKQETDGAYLDSVAGLADKVKVLKEQSSVVRTAMNAANAVDQMIDSLPVDEITSDKKLEQVQESLKAVEEAYGQLDELAKGYVQNMQTWNKVQANVEVYLDKKAQAEEVSEKIKDAVSLSEENLTDDSTVAALKAADAAYSALTRDIQSMVSNSSEIDTLKNSIAAARKEAFDKNGILTIKETIPYDVSISVVAASSDMEEKMEKQLKSDKKAELTEAFTLEAYRIMADGSREAWGQELTGVITYEDSLSNKNVYLLQIAADDQENTYIKTVTSGNTITFTMDVNGSYALGLSSTSSENKGNGDDGKDNQNNNNGNSGTNNGNNNTTTKNNSGTQSGSNKTTGTTGGTSVPKTGDTIPQQTAASAAMVIAASGLLAALLYKKRKMQ